MNAEKGEGSAIRTSRVFALDLIRAAALGCILVVHFNAAVTDSFTRPGGLTPSLLPGGVYLGDLGSALFFLVSGCALATAHPQPVEALAFYKKRALALYPMFWLAWCLCFPLRCWLAPGWYAAARPLSWLLTPPGLDQFAVAAGWVAADYACVGEWFLGSILFFYLLFPLLQRALAAKPLLTWAVVLALCLPLHRLGWDRGLLFVHLPGFLLGMTLPRLPAGGKAALLAAALALLAPLHGYDAKLFCAACAAAAFLGLWALGQAMAGRRWSWLHRACALLARYGYAAFLLHHFLITHLVQLLPADVGAVPLFAVYLLLTAAASVGLYRLTQWLTRRLAH